MSIVETIVRKRKGFIEKTSITEDGNEYKEITLYDNETLKTDITNTYNGVLHGLQASYIRGIFQRKQHYEHGVLTKEEIRDGNQITTRIYQGDSIDESTYSIQRAIDSY